MFIDRFQHSFDIGVLVFVEFTHFATVAALAESGEFRGGEEFCGEGVRGVGGGGGEEEGGGGGVGGGFEVGASGGGVNGGNGRGDGRHGRVGRRRKDGGEVFFILAG